jgi:hypothetical protein
MSVSDKAKRSDSELEEYNPEIPYYVPHLASLDPETQGLSDQSQSEIEDAHTDILTIGKFEEPTLDSDEANESAESEYEEINRNNGASDFEEEAIIQEEELSDNTLLSIDEQSDEDYGESNIDEDNNDTQKDQQANDQGKPAQGSFRREFYQANLKSTHDEVKARLEKKGHRIFKDQSLNVDNIINVPNDRGDRDVYFGSKLRIADSYSSRGYSHLYVKEVEEFATGEYFGQSALQSGRVGTNHSTTIRESKTRKSSYELENDTEKSLEGSFIGGTYWGADEKERFFTFLGRRSRHNMLGVAQGVRTKSVIECEEYYNLLYRAKADYEENNPPDWKLSYGITMKDIPAAYEMSQEWIDMEEIQAEGLTYYDTSLMTIRRPTERVIKNTMHSDLKKSDLEMLASEIDTKDSLLNLPKLWRLSNRVFSKAPYNSKLVVEHTGALFNYMSEDYYHELTNLVIDRTRSLMEQVIYSCGHLSNVWGKEVSKVALRMNMPLSSGRYWQKYPRRSRLMLNDRLAIDDENEYYNQIEKHLPVHEEENELLTAKDHDSVRSFRKIWRLKQFTLPEKYEEERDSAFKAKGEVLETQINNAFEARYAEIYSSEEESGDDDNNSNVLEEEDISDPEVEGNTNEEVNSKEDETNDNPLHTDNCASQSARSKRFNHSVSVLEEDDEFSSERQNQRQDENYFDPDFEDQKKVAFHEQFCYFEEAELDEYDKKQSEDYEYVNLVFLNSFKPPFNQGKVTDEELRVRLAERVNHRSLKNRDKVRLTALKDWHAISYINRKRILDEMTEEKVEAKVAHKKRKLEEQFAREYCEEARKSMFKRSLFLHDAYRGFLHYFPKQGSTGIMERPVWKQYESRKFYNDNYFVSNRTELRKQFNNL